MDNETKKYEKPVLGKLGNIRTTTFENPEFSSSVGTNMAIIGNLR